MKRPTYVNNEPQIHTSTMHTYRVSIHAGTNGTKIMTVFVQAEDLASATTRAKQLAGIHGSADKTFALVDCIVEDRIRVEVAL